MAKLKIACLQMEIAKGDPAANLGTVQTFASRAREAGARILLLPELWSTGFTYRELPRLAEGTPALLDELCRLAREHHLAIAGSLPELAAGRVYNTLYAVAADGTVAASYRKIHLFPGFKEELFLDPGGRVVTATLGGLETGLLVCYDLRFPELCRKLALKGARLLIVSAQWPRERLDHWRLLNQARAVENQLFVAAVNAAGRYGRTVFAGHSMVVDPTGAVVAEAGEGVELLLATVDPHEVERVRGEVDFLACRAKDCDEFLTLS